MEQHGEPSSEIKGSPRPYCGEEMERQRYLGRSHVRHRFGDDDGGRTYRFNRLGFRGGEPDPSASHRVQVFGESHAFGYFVELEESWPSAFVDLWCQHHGLEKSAVELLNFADPGASNASIARMVLTQCSVHRPDLVLVHFADVRRSEVLLDGRPHRVGPWLLDDGAAATARDAPGDLSATLLELIERGKGYFRYSLGAEERWMAPVPDTTCLLETLREILLVQSYCRAEGIRLVATCDRMEDLRAMAPQNHPILAPLVAALDETTLCNFGIWSLGEEKGDEKSGHANRARHGRFARAMFDFYLHGPSEPPELPASTVLASRAAEMASSKPDVVREFYRELPFNHYSSAETAARTLRKNPVRSNYPDLHRLLRKGDVRRVVECGCGTGWLSNSLALHYDVEVVGLDMTGGAIDRARAVARHLGVEGRATFREQDFLEDASDDPFDLLISIGVLHHTPDPRRAFDQVQAWAPHLYIGLYHQPGREPFLEYFRGLVEDDGEEAALEELRHFGVGVDEEHLRSWFRDQVLHPRETSHTLREIVRWLDAAELELMSTSINRFRRIRDREALFRAEQKLEARSRRALRRQQFFPGFFTFLAKRAEPVV